MAVIVLTVMVQGPALPAELRGDPARRFTIIQSGFFEAVGVIAFAYGGHALTFYASMQDGAHVYPSLYMQSATTIPSSSLEA